MIKSRIVSVMLLTLFWGTNSYVSRSEFVFAQDVKIDDAKIKFNTPPPFRDKTPVSVVVGPDAEIPLDKELNIKNLADLEKFAKVIQDPKYTFVFTPIGIEGNIDVIFEYDGKTKKMSLRFGPQLDGPDPNSIVEMAFGEPTNLTVRLDGKLLTATDLKSDNDPTYSKKIGSNGELIVTPKSMDPGDLVVTLNDFTYVVLKKTQVKVSDVLQSVVLVDFDQNNVRKESTSNTNGNFVFNVNVPHRAKSKFQIHGIYASDGSKTKILDWVPPAPTASTSFIRIDGETAKGDIVLYGAKASLTAMDTFKYELSSPPKGIVNKAVKSISLQITVDSTQHYLILNTIQTGNMVLPNGRVHINGNILDSVTNLPAGGFIQYELQNNKEHAAWVDLTSEGTSAIVTWRKPSESELKKAYQLPDGYTGIMPARPSEVTIKASGTPTSGPVVYNTISVRLAEIQRFTKLSVKLNVMDERTASDLYGRVTSDEYYVLMVRLINDIKDEATGLPSNQSIIAYSGSLEVAVGLEKKFLSNSKSSFPREISGRSTKDAYKVLNQLALPDDDTAKGLKDEVSNAQKELNSAIKDGTKFLNEYNRAAEIYENNRSSEAAYNAAEAARGALQSSVIRIDVAWERMYSAKENLVRLEYSKKAKIRPEIAGPDFLLNDGKWHTVSRADFSRIVPESESVPRFSSTAMSRSLPPLPKPIKEEDRGTEVRTGDPVDPPCVGTITYRPLTFEMVVNTVDRRDDRSLRSKIFRMLDLAGTTASFVTSVAVPGPGSDLPLGLEKYRNLLIPGLERLFPGQKEQNRQNVVGQTMKPLEEIPYGADITRVVFIPKKPMRGVLRGHETRISEICPFYFKIDVAVVSNQGTIGGGQQIP